MTKEEIGPIVSAYTGILCCDIPSLHTYIEKIMGRSVWTHEMADPEVQEEIKKKARPDFLKFCEWLQEK